MPRLPDKQCRFCHKWFSNKGVHEHERYHCSKNANKEMRSYSQKRCPECKKRVHEKHLSTHRYVQHDVVSPRSTRSRSPSPAASPQRRRL